MAAISPQQLDRIGRKLVRWRAQLWLTWTIAAAAALTCLLALIDILLRLDQLDRFITWSILAVLVIAGLALVRSALRKRYTQEGVAASIERTFPELDNHLINYLQFSRNPEHDPFKTAYVRSGAPPVQNLNFREMRDAEAHRNSNIALVVALLVLALPTLFVGKTWGVALWRTINPFTDASFTLTHIVDVQPGNTTVLQGDSLILSCDVQGFKGHEVRIDVDPGDADKTTYSLGRIDSDTQQTFSHRIAKVATELRYRFRAGDADPSPWFDVGTRPPPAFTDLQVTIEPPEYTGRNPETVDARKDSIIVPTGSKVTVTAVSNVPLDSVDLFCAAAEPVPLTSKDEAITWTGSMTVNEGTTIRVEATDTYGASVEEEVGFMLDPDRAPAIEIVSPGARTVLPPGEHPQIEFRISDDYGLARVMIEAVPIDGSEPEKRVAQQAWVMEDASSTFGKIWKSDLPAPRGQDVAYRVVAHDIRPDSPNESLSTPVVFTAPGMSDASKQRNELEQKAMAGLQKVIDLQKKNIAQTEQQGQAIGLTTDEKWQETAARQNEIRGITKGLLENPVKPLGTLTETVKKLYVNEMFFAIQSLKAIPGAQPDVKTQRATESLGHQEKILRQLAAAAMAAAKAKVDRRVSGLTALIEELIRGQSAVLKQTKQFVETGAEVSPVLIDHQDGLAVDLTGFINACKLEAETVRGSDAAFAAILDSMASKTEELKIRPDMMIAAERLDENKAVEAVPPETKALASLKTLQALFGNVALQQEAEKKEAFVEALGNAKEKIQKVKELRAKMQAQMDQIRGTKGKDDEMVDMMEEAYTELEENTAESLLEVPTDLHIFADLNVANDLVEDVYTMFEEIEQKEGTGKEQSAEDMEELPFAKEDVLLEMMDEMEGRIDDMEKWLSEEPDDKKVTTEAFDQEELPENGIATGALSSEVQDMISDLMEEDEDLEEAADDGAQNHAVPDMDGIGWEVIEGNIASFSAKGVSGNETPDHKEQDGRSNVGRQGMSTGETAAGSGHISEGDNNIEERRTEDPTQSGQIDLTGEADTKATGGGKLGTGKADGLGMGGGTERMDSNEEGSWAGMASLMAKKADAVYAKASMKNIRVDSLKTAAHHLRQGADAVAKGNIEQLQEHKAMAVSSLRRAEATLEAGPTAAIEENRSAGVLDDVVESAPDQAPPAFRDQVAEYYKALNDAL